MAQVIQSTPLLVGNTVSADGLTFKVVSCTLTLAGAVHSSCATTGQGAATLESLAGRNANIEAVGISANSSNIFNSVAFSSSSKVYELSYTLEVLSAGTKPSPTVKQYGSTLAGSTTAPSGDLVDITSVDSLYASTNGTGTALGTQNLNMSSGNTTGFSNAFGTLTPNFSETTTLELTTQSGGTLTLSNLKQFYGPAPEPLSVSIFGVGLAGLGAVRRARRKNRKAD